MGDVVHLNTRFRQRTPAARQAALIARFAEARRDANDVYWLKENAELLNVLECTGAAPGAGALAVHGALYEEIEKKIGFFPQYYRFFLSICLDLEDLGVPGNKGAALVDWVAETGLARAELSDLQRAEARRLCLRRGVDPLPEDIGLEDRLRGFAGRNATFALPNKKAAYELTHIVFYLSEYGRYDPKLSHDFIESLRFSGTLAFLELNIDLLSEICIALRFAGVKPPAAWEAWLRRQATEFRVESAPRPVGTDDYHPWLMLNWYLALAGQGGFAAEIPDGPVAFRAPPRSAGPLRELSDSLYQMDTRRSGDWRVMREAVGAGLSDASRNVLSQAEKAVDFEAFFAGFARDAMPEVRP